MPAKIDFYVSKLIKAVEDEIATDRLIYWERRGRSLKMDKTASPNNSALSSNPCKDGWLSRPSSVGLRFIDGNVARSFASARQTILNSNWKN
jgi:hypothetical protein